jgi:metal-responsive CopG/Arc/MetJ family transcriptional regulator
MVKATFTLDDETVETLRRTADRLGKPRSAVLREAIRDYAARAGRLSEEERRRMLRSLDAFLSHPSDRSQATVDRELREVREARRRGRRSA